MTVTPLLRALNTVLSPLRFSRKKRTWNRWIDLFVDVVDIQVATTGDAVTLNVGVLHPNVYATCWGKPAPTFIDEASCTVRARIGQLIDGRDLWWSLDDPDLCADIVDAARTHALPFLERMHSPSAMERFLTEAKVADLPYPPPAIYLAILRAGQGNRDEARAILRKLESGSPDAWRQRVRDVAKRLRHVDGSS
jgi:hypothetical protein